MFLEKIFKYPTLFLHFCYYLPFEKNLALDLYNLKLLWPIRIICALIEIGQLVLEKIFFTLPIPPPSPMRKWVVLHSYNF
jgi:hypothetical protein